MIYINPDEILPNAAWIVQANGFTETLKGLSPNERKAFIEGHRNTTWGNAHLLDILRRVVGNKCWYSEAPLEGADPNVDHFRPKGQIREVDENLQDTELTSNGYWWLAFNYKNFRLAAMHANQRRVDLTTAGGKWNFFPVRGARAPELTELDVIVEDVLAIDPCSASDIRLLWFDLEGKPCLAARHREGHNLKENEYRIRATIWLYHLDKVEIQAKRSQYVEEIRVDLGKANTHFKIWAPESGAPNLQAKANFDNKIAEIRTKITDRSNFAGAKQCTIRNYSAEYTWISDFLL